MDGVGGLAESARGSSQGGNGRANKYLQLVALPDGRRCLICDVPDAECDLVYPERTYLWAYPCDPVTRKNTGLCCYYCYRVWTARFRSLYSGIPALLEAT